MLDKQKAAFNAFYQSARHNGVLDNKTSLLVHLGAAMAVGCYPCMRVYLDQADQVGLSDEEISAVEAIVMTVSAGKVREQFNEVLTGSGSCVDDGCSD
ncbi:MAG: carboxymuconolactone decarboxylase family protein [Marinilabiliales bacterium]|nr:MAG: carboxymuconolactone decarboxylase family protein [Marinilabiliales bacterium]